jgi:hypothetical protein
VFTRGFVQRIIEHKRVNGVVFSTIEFLLSSPPPRSPHRGGSVSRATYRDGP